MSAVMSNPTTEPTGGPNNSGGNTQRGASYFFGFLITFVVLLLIFVGCGVISRRRFSARQRARFEWNMEPWAERTREGIGYVPPVLVEKYLASTEYGLSLWKDMIPLSALLVNSVKDAPPSPSPSAPHQAALSSTIFGGSDLDNVGTMTRTLSVTPQMQTEPLARSQGRSGLVRSTDPGSYHLNPNAIEAEPPRPHREHQEDGIQDEQQAQGIVRRRRGCLSYLSSFSWSRLPFWRRRERGLSMDAEQGNHSVYFDEKLQQDTLMTKDLVLQVAVLVEMPSQTSHADEEDVQLPAYEIGVANVPWTDELKNSRRSSSTLIVS